MDKKRSRKERERESRREAIITAAEKIFYKNGFEKSSMDEIARESEFTIRTLYQYFLNKEDLFFAVMDRACRKAYSYMESFINQAKNGYDKIRAILFAYYHFYKDFPDLNRFMSYFSFFKPKNENNAEYQKILQFMQNSVNEIKYIIEEGKNDGSIDPSFDTEKTTYTIYFSLKSFFHELDTSGKFLPDQEEFSSFAIDLLSRTFLKK